MSEEQRHRPFLCPVPKCTYHGGTEAARQSHMELRHPGWTPGASPPDLVTLEPVGARDRKPAPKTEPPPRKLRAAIYARVSTDDGEQDPTQQLAPCRAEAERRGFEVVWEGCDFESGTVQLWNRREGANLWKMVNNRAVDVILTYDASRLSRESAQDVMNLLTGLGKRGVGYVSATEHILDTASDNDFKDIILSFIAWANNFYVKQLRRSTKRGKKASAERGVPQGRHVLGCGIVTLCPTGAHEAGTGRSVRPERKYRKRGWKATPPTSLPPESEPAALASGTRKMGA